MPKIKIREYDLTQPGTATYSNFSVLVPGFTKNEARESEVFDENGVAEFSSASDFELYVGKIAPNTQYQEGIGPICSQFKSGNWFEKVTEFDFNNTYKGTLYTRRQLEDKEIEERNLTDNGYLILKDTVTDPTKVKFFEFTLETIWDSETEYCIIEAGNEGANGYINSKGHMGNQIAYYLLTLGYTVLYKKFQTQTEEDAKGKLRNVLSGDVSDLGKAAFWEPMKDKAIYEFRYIISGLIQNLDNISMSEVNQQMIYLSQYLNEAKSIEDTGRGDCIALCEIPKDAYVLNNKAYTGKTLINKIKSGMSLGSTYAAYFVPTVSYNIDTGADFGHNAEFPAAFHYLACAAKAFQNFNEWYAVAGFNRGISDLPVKSVSARIGDFAINELQPRTGGNAINVVTNIKGNYYLWGNRTSLTIGSELVAQDFLNIRQLVTTIKKELYVKCRQFTFDPNSDTLWINFCNSITPLLDRMKGDQGLKDYAIVRGKTTLKATLKAIIRIVPIEAVEDFDLIINLEDSITGTLVNIED